MPLITHVQLRNEVNKQFQLNFEVPGSTGEAVLELYLEAL